MSAVSAEPSPTRTATLLRSGLVVAAACAVSVLLFLWWGGLRLSPRPPLLVVATTVGASLLSVGVAWLALGRGPFMLGRARGVLLAAVVAAPLVLLAWKLGISSVFPGMTECWPERPGFRCLRLSLLTAVAPLVALVVLRRGSDPVHPLASGLAIGATVGACSWVLVDLWCPVAHVEHLLLGHVLPLLVVTLVGAVLGWLILRVRRR